MVECDELADRPLLVRAERLDEPEASVEPALVELPAERRFVTLDMGAPGERWELQVDSPGIWSEVRRATLPVEHVLELHVWREARIGGRWSAPAAERGPEQVTWRLRPVHRQGAAPVVCPVEELTVVCPVGEAGAFSCPLPAGRWNLRAKAPGWAAQHLWAVDLQAGAAVDLGSLPLRRGATVLGEVTTVDGPAIPDATLIRLLPLGLRGDDPRASRERQALELTARLNEQGFFLFEDVAPGTYEVTAHQPGYAIARVGPIEVRADLETTLLQPLVLAPPIHLTVQVDPPRPDEEGRWRVRVEPVDETSGAASEAVEGTTDETGRWTSPSIETGEYLVRVLDRRGSVLAVEGPMTLAGGDEPFLSVSLELARVAGEVRLGEEPLSADLWFGGRTGARKVRATSDREGRFETVLPRDGRWDVDVIAEAAGVSARGLAVEVEDGDDDLVIELPATEVTGSVVDPRGRPVPEARVRIVRVGEGGNFAVETDGEGLFVARGLAPATYWLEASLGERSSATHTVEVDEDAPPPPVRLVLEDRLHLTGRVVSEGGGLAGAAVIALPFSAGGMPGAPADAVTRVDGGFALALPSGTAEALLVVLPLGFGLTVERVVAGDPVEVRAAAAEGAVVLPTEVEDTAGEVGLLIVDGEAVDVSLLRQWARLHGEEPAGSAGLRVPALPSGDYAYCTTSIEEAMLVVSGRARPTRCTGGFLPAGGELSLPSP
ncbi:MAG TPA: carboxypeptidase-like regulatory domain-containing protein [Thermoanaerobaculia bacterium]|nr:carboxypeptidase-like regulatory domain-containing protein [Thermoanaerobaculia bacterium]